MSQNSKNAKTKDKVVSITYEEIGLFPRSFSRVFDRFFKQIFSDVENLVIQEYRFYRYLFLTTIQTIFILLFVPLLVNFIAKTYLIRPITEYFWNTKQTEIFLNSYEQKRAFNELHDFEEKLYFDSLLVSNSIYSEGRANLQSTKGLPPLINGLGLQTPIESQPFLNPLIRLKSADVFSLSLFIDKGLKDSSDVKGALPLRATPDLQDTFLSPLGGADQSPSKHLSKALNTLEVSAELKPIGVSDKKKKVPEILSSAATIADKKNLLVSEEPKLSTSCIKDCILDQSNSSIVKKNKQNSFYSDIGVGQIVDNSLDAVAINPVNGFKNKPESFTGGHTYNNRTSSIDGISAEPIARFSLNNSQQPINNISKENRLIQEQVLIIGSDDKKDPKYQLPPILTKSKYQDYYNKNFSEIFNSLQEKTLELAIRYNNHSIESITNFFADFISLMTLLYLLVSLEIQINITKSFLLEVFFGLDDSKKSLLILIMTDLLVGYHSSNLWELFFQFLFNHYGIPESQTGIFLLVATLPVLLDVLFKYLIFRHLNRASPATVATYHAIIE